MDHRIIECVIGDAKPELKENENIQRVYSDSLLWHKEALLNKVIAELPAKYKYVFWVDADVLFTNDRWLVNATHEMRMGRANIVQPFEYCVHLEKDQIKPDFDVNFYKKYDVPTYRNKKVWRSFAANNEDSRKHLIISENYDAHGHVGFAWGAVRELLRNVPLYDRALIGGADHIMAHASLGHIPHSCIQKSFTDDIDAVNAWSREFYKFVEGKLGYVSGDLYHIWHGDIDKRQYLKRIKDFTLNAKTIKTKDKNGLYVNENTRDQAYMANYFAKRETLPDDGFLNSLMIGYMSDSTLIGTVGGGNMVGAMLGDMMNEGPSHNHHQHPESTPPSDIIGVPASEYFRTERSEEINPNYDTLIANNPDTTYQESNHHDSSNFS